jgi:hypothetical protein
MTPFCQVADILPSKTIPTTGRGSSVKCKRPKYRAIEGIEGEAAEAHEGQSQTRISRHLKTSTGIIDKTGIVVPL